MSDNESGQRYKAFVEADAILVPKRTFESEEEAREYIEETTNTGHLGPPKVRAVEADVRDPQDAGG